MKQAIKETNMNKRLPHLQNLQFLKYLDCKKRTKKQIALPSKNYPTDDEKLVHFMLENSSITDRDSERSFNLVCDAVNVICRQLCPGQWCTRSHCQNYSSTSAYNCTKTRPSVCKEHAKYIEKKKIRDKKENKDEQRN